MIIADRCIQIEQGNQSKSVAVRIFAPQREGKGWSCAYEIDWPEGTRRAVANGFDSAQALILALQKIGAEIYTSDYHKSGALSWSNPRQGYGFPVAHNLRDMLIGDDAKYL